MSRWADWFMIPPVDADHFLDVAFFEGDAAVHELLAPLLESESPDVDMDKAWEPIHRCLTSDQTPHPGLDFNAGEYPLKLCVLGGEPVLTEGYRSAAIVQPSEVADVAAALWKIGTAWLSERFFALPDTQFHEITDELFDWVWFHFRDLSPFFTRAAEKGCGVLCTISH